MKILGIETSCDETAICVLDASGNFKENFKHEVLGNALISQASIHAQYGGVFPNLAKREHAKNLVPILEAALEEAEMLAEDTQVILDQVRNQIERVLEREPGLGEQFLDFVSESERPALDAIAVTAGPGLEPALWVGVNFAKALSLAWDVPLVAVNHMEGHILAGLAHSRSDLKSDSQGQTLEIRNVEMPVLALLISGGHTQLVLMRQWLQYELIGQTRDDAVGEAFDKVARMLGLPYPGGPEISKLAESVRTSGVLVSELGHPMSKFTLPRPMIDSPTCDFSFAGLKTAVLYLLRDKKDINDEQRRHIAREFEDAAAEVLWKKASRALKETGARTLVLGGGVSANTHIRRVFVDTIAKEHPAVALRIPAASLTTDNAIMIALAGFYHAQHKEFANLEILKANGNMHLAELAGKNKES